MSRFSAPIAEQIWDMKYRLKTADDEPIDACVEESWRRVAKDLARVEAEPGIWEEKFYAALEDFKFLENKEKFENKELTFEELCKQLDLKVSRKLKENKDENNFVTLNEIRNQ